MQPNSLSTQAKSNLLHLLRYPRRFLLPSGSPSYRGPRRERCNVLCAPRSSDRLQPLLPGVDLSFMDDPGTPPEKLVIAVQNLKPFLPSGCEVLGEGDIKIPGSHPVSKGGFADVWFGEMKDGTRVAIKSQRRHTSSGCFPAFLVGREHSTTELNTQLTGCYPQRMYREALMYSRLNGGDENLVPFVAIYSTARHPFGLVFGFMEHLNLRDYLRNNPEIPRLKLV